MATPTQQWLIAFNWKMNPITRKIAMQLFTATKRKATLLRKVQTVVCPPLPYLDLCKRGTPRCALGAQDIFWEAEGAYTGAVSYMQLRDLGVKYVLVGHSESRARGERNSDIHKKIKAALLGSLTPIVCVGESSREERGGHLEVVKTQIEEALYGLPKTSMKQIVIAYEPLWAIGKGAVRGATPDEIFEMVIYIKKIVSDMYGTKSIPPTKILYGGSVHPLSVKEILLRGGVDGLLVGRASLDVKAVVEILQQAEALKR